MMTARTKSALMLVTTLFIGILLGSLLTGALQSRRMENVMQLRSARGLSFLLEDVIRPESEEQRAAIRAVLEDAGPRLAEEMNSSRRRMQALMDSVRAELDPLLTDEQKARLDERARVERRPFGAPGPRGPEEGRRRRHPPTESGDPPPPDPGGPPPGS